MTAPFECEVRFLIDDVEVFRRHIATLGGRVRFAYAFTDHYYRPLLGAWDSRTRALRVREHHRPAKLSEVLLTWVDLVQVNGLAFKRSRFPEGKVRLHLGPVGECRAIADALGYAPWLVVRKIMCEFYDIPDVGELVAEQVDGIGWMCEVEVAGQDPQAAAAAIRRKLDALGVSVDAVLPEPLAALVAARITPDARKVYFSGSISGGRTLQPVYARIVALLQQRGYEVLTTHVAAPDVRDREGRGGAGAAGIYNRDVRWLAECDLVIAEVSVPSLGVGVEISTAQHLGKPIVCLCRADVALSAMIEGNPGVRVLRYQDESELPTLLEAALPIQASGTAARLGARETPVRRPWPPAVLPGF
jgi:adenylate cyclase class IV